MNWLELVPPPRPLPEPSGPFGDRPFEWDVFISYRSSDRVWAIALYDQLVAAGYRVFLDQFVLINGVDLAKSLSDTLDKSVSGVLLLSQDANGSNWVQSEAAKMRRLREDRHATTLPFNYVIARIDNAALPFQDQNALYVDFSNGYEDGPRGAALVHLVHGLVGKPLPAGTVRKFLQVDENVKYLLTKLHTLDFNRQHDSIAQLLQSDREELKESPNIAATGVQMLISADREEQALDAVRSIQKVFPRSLRLQQLQALALRRLAQREQEPGARRQLIYEAQEVLGDLYFSEHRDAETLGIYGATWWMRYELSQDRSDLEQSRELYAQGYKSNPRDAYVGINTASKSALLGELDEARRIAQEVGKLTNAYADGSDFYKAFSLAEALLLLGRHDEAAEIYEKTCQRHRQREGDLEGTRVQVNALIGALNVPDAEASKLRQALQG
jgi:tetratricopeptide (TPR) repeat protein